MAKGDKKLETRQRIIKAASQSFRSHGYAGIGVDGIAKAAGVTSGAFYAHLGSKNAAFDIALRAGLDEVIQAIPIFQKDYAENWVEKFSEYYLSQSHRDDLADGCAMTTLSPEVVRSGAELQTVYESKMNQIVNLLADGLEGSSRDDRQSRGWSLLAVLIGGLTMARAVKSTKTVKNIAASVKNSAVSVVGAILTECN